MMIPEPGEVIDGAVGYDVDGLVITGSMNGDLINGEWNDTVDEISGTWKGKRTL